MLNFPVQNTGYGFHFTKSFFVISIRDFKNNEDKMANNSLPKSFMGHSYFMSKKLGANLDQFSNKYPNTELNYQKTEPEEK